MVVAMVVTASLSFSAMSHAKEMSSAYSRIHISTSSGILAMQELAIYLEADGDPKPLQLW